MTIFQHIDINGTMHLFALEWVTTIQTTMRINSSSDGEHGIAINTVDGKEMFIAVSREVGISDIVQELNPDLANKYNSVLYLTREEREKEECKAICRQWQAFKQTNEARQRRNQLDAIERRKAELFCDTLVGLWRDCQLKIIRVDVNELVNAYATKEGK